MTDVRYPTIPPGMGQRIRARRDELGYPRRAVSDHVAEMTGRKYRESWLQGIETGSTGIYLNAAIALADFLGMSLDEMVGRNTGPDIIVESPDGSTTAIEIKQRLRDGAETPLEEALQDDGTPQPIPLEPRRRGPKREGGRPRRT